MRGFTEPFEVQGNKERGSGLENAFRPLIGPLFDSLTLCHVLELCVRIHIC